MARLKKVGSNIVETIKSSQTPLFQKSSCAASRNRPTGMILAFLVRPCATELYLSITNTEQYVKAVIATEPIAKSARIKAEEFNRFRPLGPRFSRWPMPARTICHRKKSNEAFNIGNKNQKTTK